MHAGCNQRPSDPDVTQQVEIAHIPHAASEYDRMIRSCDRFFEKIGVDA
jgi:hypothetical protein